VRDYFKAQSGGKFVPTFDVVGIVKLSKSYQYYGTNDKSGNDQNLDQLPGDVTAAAVSQLGADFSKYVVPAADNNHAAGVPLLCMFYAGRGEATEQETTANSKYLWPCEWDANEDPVAQGKYQNVQFNSFFIGNELTTGGSSLMGMGVFCHEFGHALGLPDFYCTNYSYSNDDAFGLWSIMDCGAYVDDYSRLPMGYNAYEKSYMGWLDLKEIGDATEVALGSPDGAAENSAYILRNSNTETFIFENRQPGTWYPVEFGSGVLVTRIAYSYNQWSGNTLNNTQSKKRACVLTADGSKLYYSASKANLYGNTKTSIASLKTLSGTSKTVGITNIVKNNDGTITFAYSGGGVTPTPQPDPQPDGTIFYESFNQCDGKGGNDGSWNGSGVAVGEFTPDNDGWNASNAYGADQCAKFGTGSVLGYVTTPSISLNGEAQLTFRAGAWDGTKDGTQLEVEVEGGTASPQYFTLKKGAFTDYTATVQGSGIIFISFSQSKGRFFLDEVLLKADVTGIDEVKMQRTQKGGIYTLDGRYLGTSLESLGHGLYVKDGKKVVK
jgi:M6 family metalloprotease-like protein